MLFSGERGERVCGPFGLLLVDWILACLHSEREPEGFDFRLGKSPGRVSPDRQFAALTAARAGIKECPALNAAGRDPEHEVPSALDAELGTLTARLGVFHLALCRENEA